MVQVSHIQHQLEHNQDNVRDLPGDTQRWISNLPSNEDDRCSKASLKTKSHSSRSSRRSSKSNSSASSKSDRIEGKLKLAELTAQELYLEKMSASRKRSTKTENAGKTC